MNKMFGIIDTNPTLQIIATDWIEEYYTFIKKKAKFNF